MLTDRERERYERQIRIPGWDESGQEKLKKARVAVVGAGGLGSAVLTCLAAAGVGELRVIDGDRVQPGNLNRQVLHGTGDVGRNKVDSARDRLLALNPEIRVEPVAERIHEGNVFDLLCGLPVVDALDDLEARLLVNRAAQKSGFPLFHGAVYGLEGRATTIVPGETACMQCLYRQVVPGTVPVAGVTPAVIGSVQAAEVLKYLLGLGDLLCNRLLIYDGLGSRFREVRLKKDPQCPACGPESSPARDRRGCA
jgi:molybdopterin-synthase adenylyltransferase